jgi:hypothetical protein
MRKVLLIFLAAVLLASGVCAQEWPSLAFYADAGRTTNCIPTSAIPPAPGNVTQYYVFCKPSVRGMRGAEFKVNLPADVTLITVQNSPNISLSLGNVQTGIALSVSSCLTDWNWVVILVMFVNSTDQLTATFAPSDVSGLMVFPNCETGYPTEDAVALNNMYINVDPSSPLCVFGTGEKSWGAIKNIYRN